MYCVSSGLGSRWERRPVGDVPKLKDGDDGRLPCACEPSIDSVPTCIASFDGHLQPQGTSAVVAPTAAIRDLLTRCR